MLAFVNFKVERLPVHLPERQSIVFEGDQNCSPLIYERNMTIYQHMLYGKEIQDCGKCKKELLNELEEFILSNRSKVKGFIDKCRFS